MLRLPKRIRRPYLVESLEGISGSSRPSLPIFTCRRDPLPNTATEIPAFPQRIPPDSGPSAGTISNQYFPLLKPGLHKILPCACRFETSGAPRACFQGKCPFLPLLGEALSNGEHFRPAPAIVSMLGLKAHRLGYQAHPAKAKSSSPGPLPTTEKSELAFDQKVPLLRFL